MVIPLGTGLSEWEAIVLGRAQRVISEGLRRILLNDFDQDALAGAEIAKDGTIAYNSGLTGGVANLQTGTTANGFAVVVNAGGAILIPDPSAINWYVHGRVWPVTACDAEAQYHCIGMQGPTAADYMDFGLNGDIDTTFLSLRLVKASAESHFVTTVPADQTRLLDYGFGHDVAAGEIRCTVEDQTVLTTSDMTNLTDQRIWVYSFVRNGATAANRQLLVDNIAVIVEDN